MSQFRLFPPLTPTSKDKVPSRGGKKVLVDKQASSSHSNRLEDLRGSKKTDAVLRQIRENAKVIQPPKPPPKAHVAKSKTEPALGSKVSGSDRHNKKKPKEWTSPSSVSSSTTLVNQHASPESLPSLDIPMKSIFPRYNPSLPLNQQAYYPQLSINRLQSHHKPKGLVLSPEPEIDRALGPKTVPASVMNFPAGLLDAVEIHYSSAAELQSLWEAANGQRPENQTESFNLRLTRTDPTTFTFGDPNQPFYTLRTTTPNELTISRTNPSKPTNSIPIMTLTLKSHHRREPPNDSLVSVIFSRLAAMLAIEQAEEQSKQHHLSPSEAFEAESKALKRAQELESCRLTWNNDLRLYELDHPSLSKQKTPALVGAAGIPLSPVRPKHPGNIHITVSTRTPTSFNENDPKHPPPQPQSQPPTIIATTPTPSNATSTETARLAATPRTSTLPLTDSDEPLASLDLCTRTLRISAGSVIATIPSLYAIDSVVAGVLAVAVADEGCRGVLMGMEIGQIQSPFRGELVTTVAEGEEAVQGVELVEGIKSSPNGVVVDDEDRQAGSSSKNGFLNWFSFASPRRQRPKPKKEKNRQIVIEEFDLEKYGRYGRGSSREGEKLPPVARGVLRVIFWGLDLVVRMLTAMVKVVAWILVNLTRCVTSKQF